MQNIQAKKESLMRLFGMVIILLGFLISIIFDFFIHNLLLYSFILLIIIPWFILIILMKLEIDIIINKILIFMIILAIYSILMIIIGIGFSSLEQEALLFIFTIIANISLILGWNYALSIFKKKKLIFISGILIYLILTTIFRLTPLMNQIFWLISLTPVSMIALGLILIIFAELRMKKKGLLNWV